MFIRYWFTRTTDHCNSLTQVLLVQKRSSSAIGLHSAAAQPRPWQQVAQRPAEKYQRRFAHGSLLPLWSRQLIALTLTLQAPAVLDRYVSQTLDQLLSLLRSSLLVNTSSGQFLVASSLMFGNSNQHNVLITRSALHLYHFERFDNNDSIVRKQTVIKCC